MTEPENLMADLYAMRHFFAHLPAVAVPERWPAARFGVSPAIDGLSASTIVAPLLKSWQSVAERDPKVSALARLRRQRRTAAIGPNADSGQ
jgi:hypothetical protein